MLHGGARLIGSGSVAESINAESGSAIIAAHYGGFTFLGDSVFAGLLRGNIVQFSDGESDLDTGSVTCISVVLQSGELLTVEHNLNYAGALSAFQSTLELESLGTQHRLDLSKPATLSQATIEGGTIVLRGAAILASSKISSTVVNDGAVDLAFQSTLDDVGNVRGKGSFVFGGDSTFEFGGPVVATQAVIFKNEDTLRLDQARTFKAVLENFTTGDTIDLAGFATAGAHFRFTENNAGTGGILNVVSGDLRAAISLDGTFLASGFRLTADGAGTGTVVTYTAPLANAAQLVAPHDKSTGGATIANGGVENVHGTASGTTVVSGGVENVQSGGLADNVTFAGASSTLQLATPSGLKGAISNWRVGDVVDFLKTAVTGVHQTGDVLTVSYGDQKASYQLAGQQANTEFKLQSDGHGGTELILTPTGLARDLMLPPDAPLVGVLPLHSDAHHLMLL